MTIYILWCMTPTCGTVFFCAHFHRFVRRTRASLPLFAYVLSCRWLFCSAKIIKNSDSTLNCNWHLLMRLYNVMDDCSRECILLMQYYVYTLFLWTLISITYVTYESVAANECRQIRPYWSMIKSQLTW